MRAVLLILVLLSFLPGRSQTPLDYNIMNYGRPMLFGAQQTFPISSHANKNWQLSGFSGLYSGYSFLPGAGATFLSAPVGLQLTRRLDKNWYAFAQMSAAPEFLLFNSSMRDPGFNKTYPGGMLPGMNRLSGYSSAGAGLIYVNDARTFSISGSVHVYRDNYPVYPVSRTGMNAMQPAGR